MNPRGAAPVQPSFLDRLIGDYDYPRLSWDQSVDLFKQAVRRDLEWLLNTRRNPTTDNPNERPGTPGADVWFMDERHSEVKTSMFQYGFPDVNSFSAKDRNRITALLDETIKVFEPRLQDVRVTCESSPEDKRVLRFTIRAMLRTDPAPRRVFFDTVLQLNSGEYEVQEQPSAG